MVGKQKGTRKKSNEDGMVPREEYERVVVENEELRGQIEGMREKSVYDAAVTILEKPVFDDLEIIAIRYGINSRVSSKEFPEVPEEVKKLIETEEIESRLADRKEVIFTFEGYRFVAKRIFHSFERHTDLAYAYRPGNGKGKLTRELGEKYFKAVQDFVESNKF